MVVVLNQDLECVALVLVHVPCLDIFDESGENGKVALYSVMWRDILPASARKEFGLEGGKGDLYLGQ